jgi:Tol biopolymer transport system component
VVDADGSNPRNLTKYAAGDEGPAWSPDGQQIAFWSNRAGRQAGQAYATDIFVMDADGSNPRNLTDNSVTDTSPTWSPDGRYIAFASDRDGNYEIYVMDADGSNPGRLTNDEAKDLWPAWSPDGRYIAFVSDRDGDFEIYVMDADGSNPRNLTNNEEREVGEEGRIIGFDSSPTWSPDGRYIAFQSDREGESQEIWVMEADGSNPRRLTDMRAVHPSWSGRRLEVVKQPVEGWGHHSQASVRLPVRRLLRTWRWAALWNRRSRARSEAADRRTPMDRSSSAGIGRAHDQCSRRGGPADTGGTHRGRIGSDNPGQEPGVVRYA